MTYLFCAYRDWALKLYKELKKKYPDMHLLSTPKKLTANYVKKKKPKLIFFPDWSWIVPDEIISNYKCICFHESDLPNFRGGSPIQNQIIRGIEKTKSTAFLMDKGLDEGDILLQKTLLLTGSLDQIFERMIQNDLFMVEKIIQGKYKLKKQRGNPTRFKRRSPKDSELESLKHSKKYIYNFIRMLDNPYPNAFINLGKHKIVFKKAFYIGKKLSITGEIE